MKAKLKHPKLWAVIWNEDGDIVHASHKKPSRKWKDSNGEKVSVLCYHLHPGNEVKKVRGELARALNVLKMKIAFHPQVSSPWIVNRLRAAGFPVRWDAKKGRFV